MSENTPKTVLVTGGNRGIGYEIAKEFQAAGHNVCITYRSGEAPENFSPSRQMYAMPTALTKHSRKLKQSSAPWRCWSPTQVSPATCC